MRSSDDGSDARRGTALRRRLSWWQEALLLLAIAVALALLVKTLLVEAFYIPSASMEPGLVKDDRILVQKVSYAFGGSPERGDVVVFSDPDHWLQDTEEPEPSAVGRVLGAVGLSPSGSGHLVKRVVGVAGDVIECCDDDGRLVINGVPVDESAFVAEGLTCDGPMTGDCGPDAWTAGPVPAGHLFVMGDNRGNSADSTVHLCTPNETDCTDNPYVDVDLVVGKVFGLVWPLDRWGTIGTADALADVPDADPSAAPDAPDDPGTAGGR